MSWVGLNWWVFITAFELSGNFISDALFQQLLKASKWRFNFLIVSWLHELWLHEKKKMYILSFVIKSWSTSNIKNSVCAIFAASVSRHYCLEFHQKYRILTSFSSYLRLRKTPDLIRNRSEQTLRTQYNLRLVKTIKWST